MPIRSKHYVNDCGDVLVRYSFVKQITHGIYKYHLRRIPTKRFCELFRHQPEVEPLFVRVALDTTESLRKHLGITVLATWANLGTAPDRIPRCVRPFDRTVPRL